jgi:alkylresorcinol/alkylpyrone synthase
MPKVFSVATAQLPYTVNREKSAMFAREMFGKHYSDIERLLYIFQSGQIDKRHFAVPLEWFYEQHSFEEKNHLFIEKAVQHGVEAIEDCLHSQVFEQPIHCEEVEAIFLVSSTGISTPSIEARIMNRLPFSAHTKRIPLWGLGCGGGVSGLARAMDYCLAFPKAKVLLVCIELCSLTFQPSDLSKSNLVGTSLFADGVAAALVAGDQADVKQSAKLVNSPMLLASQTTLLPDSLEVMGWRVNQDGLFVIFSRDIPLIVQRWLEPNITSFLSQSDVKLEEIASFIAHPGGRKVIEAYQETFSLTPEQTNESASVLRDYGNMSSATVLYVLERFMNKPQLEQSYGLMTALGPGFSSELLLLEW